MSFPVNDWQFWVATLLALAAAYYLLRPLLPHHRRKARAARTGLTVEGRAVQSRKHAPPKPRSARRTAMSILITAAAIYLIYLAAMVIFQHTLIFPRFIANQPDFIDPPANAITTRLESEPGASIDLWIFRAPNATEANPAPAVIYTHGNAERIDQNLHIARFYNALGITVCLPEYRGYGRSTGAPSQAALSKDMRAARLHLLDHPFVDPNRLFYHGRSIGAGVALDLASHHPPPALILDAPFTSLRAMTARYLVPPFLLRSPFPNDQTIQSLDIPILIHHGEHDQIIPTAHGRKLAQLGADTRLVLLNCGHNDLPDDWSAYADTIRAFLEEAKILD